MQMKFNWGTGLLIFILIFISLCIAFMIFAFNQNINLVQEGYYEKGVDFDKERDKTQRSIAYVQQITIENMNNHVVVAFPDSFINKVQEAEVFFYRPSDDHADVTVKLVSDTLVLPSANFIQGRYIVKISWTMNEEQFMIEKEFSVN
jgi:hypothetical protein